MRVHINVEEFSRNFDERERIAILASCIQGAYRYDYENIARTINMPGRTALAERVYWPERNWLLYWILFDEQIFSERISPERITNEKITQLNKKRTILAETINVAGFEIWISEFVTVYSLNWLMNRVTEVLTITRPDVISAETVQYDLNLSLEGVR